MGDVSTEDFARWLLGSFAFLQTQDSLDALVAWRVGESGHRVPVPATWNPLNTTLPMVGSTKFNAIGVQNYPTFFEGLEATFRTLSNGRYNEILVGLKQGVSAAAICQAIQASPWGTGREATNALPFVRENRGYFYGLVIGDTTVAGSVQPDFYPPIRMVSQCQFLDPKSGQLANAIVQDDGAVYCDPPGSYLGGANGKQFFVGRMPAKIVANPGGYKIIDTNGEEYAFPTDAT